MWVVLQGFPQPTDVNIQGARVFHVIGIPYSLEQFLPAQNLPGSFHHFSQQVRKSRRQPNFSVLVNGNAAFWIQDQIAPDEHAFMAVILKRPQAVDQLLHREWQS